MKKKHIVASVGIGLGIIALGSVLITTLLIPKVEVIRVRLDLDEETRPVVAQAIAAFVESEALIEVLIMPYDDSSNADLTIGRGGGGIPWRTRGWRLWSRLETLAWLEGKLGRPLILPLRTGKLAGADFDNLIGEARALGIAGFSVPETPQEYGATFNRWLELSASAHADKNADTRRKLYLATTRTVQAALDGLSRGKVLFVLAPDQFGTWIQRTPDTHPEAFPLPGSRSPGASWAIGSTERIMFPPESKEGAANAAADLATFLTSKGTARQLAGKLPGDFHTWTVAPHKGELPLVEAPETLVDVPDKLVYPEGR